MHTIKALAVLKGVGGGGKGGNRLLALVKDQKAIQYLGFVYRWLL